MIRSSAPRKKVQKRRVQRDPIPFARVKAEIQLESSHKVAESRVFLTDMSPSGLGCFVNFQIDKGEKVSVVIEQPKHLFVKGEVIWCSPYTLDTKIISSEFFRFRIGVRFTFDTPEEEQALKQFCEDLYRHENKDKK
jgi:hypothetical protein